MWVIYCKIYYCLLFIMYCGILWYTVVYCGILWYTVIYCGILWYTVIYYDILSYLPSLIGQTSGTMVPSTSEDRSEAEVLHDPHDYDEVPVEEMASRPPMPVPAPSDVYSEVREGERGRIACAHW